MRSLFNTKHDLWRVKFQHLHHTQILTGDLNMQSTWVQCLVSHDLAGKHLSAMSHLTQICVTREVADKWMLQQDNNLCHTALAISEFFLPQNTWLSWPYPFVHMIWAVVIFFFSKNWNMFWKHRCETLENIQKTVTDHLKALPVEGFLRCYQEGQRLCQCLATQGNYFEGDNVVWKS